MNLNNISGFGYGIEDISGIPESELSVESINIKLDDGNTKKVNIYFRRDLYNKLVEEDKLTSELSKLTSEIQRIAVLPRASWEAGPSSSSSTSAMLLRSLIPFKKGDSEIEMANRPTVVAREVLSSPRSPGPTSTVPTSPPVSSPVSSLSSSPRSSLSSSPTISPPTSPTSSSASSSSSLASSPTASALPRVIDFPLGKQGEIRTTMPEAARAALAEAGNLESEKAKWEAKALEYANRLGLTGEGYQGYRIELTLNPDRTQAALIVKGEDGDDITDEILQKRLTEAGVSLNEAAITNYLNQIASMKGRLAELSETAESAELQHLSELVNQGELIRALHLGSRQRAQGGIPEAATGMRVGVDINPPSPLQLLCQQLGLVEGTCLARQDSTRAITIGQRLTLKGDYASNTHIAIFLQPTRDKIRLMEATSHGVGVTELTLDEFIEYVDKGLRVVSHPNHDLEAASHVIGRLKMTMTAQRMRYKFEGLIKSPFASSSPTSANIKATHLSYQRGELLEASGAKSTAAICSELGVRVIHLIQIENQKRQQRLEDVTEKDIGNWIRQRHILPLDYSSTTPAELVQGLEEMGYRSKMLSKHSVTNAARKAKASLGERGRRQIAARAREPG